MRSYSLGLAYLSVAVATFCACGSSGEQTVGSGGSGPMDCHDSVVISDPCNACLHEQCCAELAACTNAPTCFACWDYDSTMCEEDPQRPLMVALDHCTAAKCSASCGEPWSERPTNPNCMDVEPGGGVTLADCTNSETSVIRGTIDGKPFDETAIQTILGVNAITKNASWGITFLDAINGYGSLDVTWTGYLVAGIPMPVTGTLQLPGEKFAHIVDPGSTLWVKCNVEIYGFSLVLKGGDHVTGCAHGWP
jgi:hypothetical protein